MRVDEILMVDNCESDVGGSNIKWLGFTFTLSDDLSPTRNESRPGGGKG